MLHVILLQYSCKNILYRPTFDLDDNIVILFSLLGMKLVCNVMKNYETVELSILNDLFKVIIDIHYTTHYIYIYMYISHIHLVTYLL